MTKKQVIGNNGKLLWNILEDTKLFKALTTGGTVIMGHNTWDSLPAKFRPLPNRENIVVSHKLRLLDGVEVANNIKEAIDMARGNGNQIFCIGGAQVYKEFLPEANILHISWVKKEYAGNVLFPQVNWSEWNCEEEKDYGEFVYKKYIRKE